MDNIVQLCLPALSMHRKCNRLYETMKLSMEVRTGREDMCYGRKRLQLFVL